MKTEYPKTQLEAVRYFADEDTAHGFMVKMRWPNGVACPVCGSEDVKFTKTAGEKPRRLWNCKGCKKQFTAKVGTIFEDSPIQFSKWLPAVWMAVNAKNGISSCELSRAIGVTQKSAWFMLHRIRHALKVGNFEKLSGEVEADETFVGGLGKNMHKDKKAKISRGGTGKIIVMGILQRNGNVVAGVIPDIKAPTLQAQIHKHVEHGSSVFTDSLLGYNGLNSHYAHQSVDHEVCYGVGQVHTNSIENFWSLFKRGLKGTYIHVDKSHMQAYVDEQSFRFNERFGGDGERFVTATKTTSGKRLTYEQLTAQAD